MASSPSTHEAGAITTAVLFGVCWLAALANFRLTRFRVYLLTGLSAALRVVAASCRAAYWGEAPDFNTNLQAVALACAGAGLGISIAVQILVMGCWFKNADAASKPAWPRPFPTLSVGVRLVIAPVITFGPILGIAAAALIFGYPGDASKYDMGMQLRKAASIGILGCLCILLAIEAWAVATAARGSGMPALQDPNKLVYVTLLCGLLLLIPCTFNVVAIWEPRFSSSGDADLYYPLVALPELLQLAVIVLVPRLLARMAMGERYEEWQAEAMAQTLPSTDGSVKGASAGGSSKSASAVELA